MRLLSARSSGLGRAHECLLPPSLLVQSLAVFPNQGGQDSVHPRDIPRSHLSPQKDLHTRVRHPFHKWDPPSHSSMQDEWGTLACPRIPSTASPHFVDFATYYTANTSLRMPRAALNAHTTRQQTKVQGGLAHTLRILGNTTRFFSSVVANLRRGGLQGLGVLGFSIQG